MIYCRSESRSVVLLSVPIFWGNSEVVLGLHGREKSSLSGTLVTSTPAKSRRTVATLAFLARSLEFEGFQRYLGPNSLKVGQGKGSGYLQSGQTWYSLRCHSSSGLLLDLAVHLGRAFAQLLVVEFLSTSERLRQRTLERYRPLHTFFLQERWGCLQYAASASQTHNTIKPEGGVPKHLLSHFK